VSLVIDACAFSADVVKKTGDATEDALISRLITAAREYCEDITRRALATQTIEGYLDWFPCGGEIELPMPPLQSVTSLIYKDSVGTETTMTATTQYLADLESDRGRIVLPYGVSWPTFTPYPINPIKIRYVAGYYATKPIPKIILQAMLLHIGYFYNNRDAVAPDGATDRAIKVLLNLKRAGWF